MFSIDLNRELLQAFFSPRTLPEYADNAAVSVKKEKNVGLKKLWDERLSANKFFIFCKVCAWLHNS
jgi:hypothetical protein